MQKKLIALAVAAAAAAPAFAQSNVTIYGQMRVSVSNINSQVANTDKWAVDDQFSRIGFKGAEDLGGGLKAIWQWESQLNDTNNVGVAGNTADISQRNTFLGLAGGFGTVLFGNHDTPYKLGGSADLYGDTKLEMYGGNGANGASGGTSACIIGCNFKNRLGNVWAYISPTFSGFHVAIAGVAGENPAAGNTNANGLSDALSMVAVYENGPLKATLGHETVKSNAVNALASAAGNTNTEKAKGTKLNLAYKMGAIGLGYTHESSNEGATTEAAPRSKDKANLVSVSYAMGATTLGVQTGKFDDKAVADADRSAWALGATHALSKRTQAYAGYIKSNPKGSNNNVSVVTMGLNHSF